MKSLVIVSCLFPLVLGAQDILEVIDQSVIIQKDDLAGKIGDEKWVVRESGQGVLPVGRVKIHKAVKNVLVADITAVEPGYQIVIGDRIANNGLIHPERYLTRQDQMAVKPFTQVTAFRRVRLGVSLGAIMPYENIYRHYEHSYQTGVLLQVAFSQRSALLLDLMYSLRDRQIPSQIRNAEFSQSNNRSVLNLNILLRQGVLRNVFMDFGCGVYVPRVSVTASSSEREINSLEYCYGVCGGLAIDLIDRGSFSFFITPRYHAYLSNTELVESLTGGVNLIF